MKVLALGGAGHLGLGASKRLTASHLVSEIIIAGRNREKAEEAAAQLGEKATVIQVDIIDEGQLASVAASCDIVVNTAGPDYKVTLPALRGAIEAGVQYCDISQEGPIVERALALDGDAKAAGITALVGIGLCPGLSNLLMVYAARQLEHADEVAYHFVGNVATWGDPRTILNTWRTSGRVPAEWQQLMRLAGRNVRLYREGGWTDVDPIEDAALVEPPQGGKVIVYPFGSSEPITVPGVLPNVRSVVHLESFFPPQLNMLWFDFGRRVARGELDESAAAVLFYERLASRPNVWLAGQWGYESTRIEWVEAVGIREGRRVRYRCWPSASWTSVSGPLAAAALSMLSGDIQPRGVLSAESCLDPMSFFARSAQYGRETPPKEELIVESIENL